MACLGSPYFAVASLGVQGGRVDLGAGPGALVPDLGARVIAAGGMANGSVQYQLVYRNPSIGFCTSGTINFTNTVEVLWIP